MGNGNGTTNYTGFEKRSVDRRDHICKHEEDFGALKTNVINLGDQMKTHIEDQKERHNKVDKKFDGIETSITDLTASQEALPGKIINGIAGKKKEKRAELSTTLTTISKVIGIVVTLGGGLWWLFTFVANNSQAMP